MELTLGKEWESHTLCLSSWSRISQAKIDGFSAFIFSIFFTTSGVATWIFWSNFILNTIRFETDIWSFTHTEAIHSINSQLFKKKLEDISPFRGSTDTPVLDFWWRLLWVSKPTFVGHSAIQLIFVAGQNYVVYVLTGQMNTIFAV